jgi:quercetin dioxygenase-like cupin family protein
MEIKRAGSQVSAKGPSEWFTGTVRIDPLFQAPDPAFVQGASVTFEPGADGMAHAPVGADSHRDGRLWPRTKMGRFD